MYPWYYCTIVCIDDCNCVSYTSCLVIMHVCTHGIIVQLYVLMIVIVYHACVYLLSCHHACVYPWYYCTIVCIDDCNCVSYTSCLVIMHVCTHGIIVQLYVLYCDCNCVSYTSCLVIMHVCTHGIIVQLYVLVIVLCILYLLSCHHACVYPWYYCTIVCIGDCNCVSYTSCLVIMHVCTHGIIVQLYVLMIVIVYLIPLVLSSCMCVPMVLLYNCMCW